jgi:hypothetical protein
MSTRTRRNPVRTPLPRAYWLAPGLLLLAALVVFIAGLHGVAAGFLVGSVGAWLVVMGRHRRWKGAPEAGYLLCAVGLFIILAAFWPV